MQNSEVSAKWEPHGPVSMRLKKQTLPPVRTHRGGGALSSGAGLCPQRLCRVTEAQSPRTGLRAGLPPCSAGGAFKPKVLSNARTRENGDSALAPGAGGSDWSKMH